VTSASINAWGQDAHGFTEQVDILFLEKLAHERGDVHRVLGHLPPPRRLLDIGEDGRWPFQFKDVRSESPPRLGTVTLLV